MSKLERAYIDVAEQTFKKVTAKDGRTMHFKDGTPISPNAFHGGLANKIEEGQRVGVAIPNPDAPLGFNRIQVSQTAASKLGQELALLQEGAREIPEDTVLLDGEPYDIEELEELNNELIKRFGPDVVMKY